MVNVESRPVAAPAIVLAATLGLAAACWAAAAWLMDGMDMGVATRPHGSLAAGLVVIAAGAYELTPVKRHFRRRCREDAHSGLGFGLCCAGSSIGLMALALALAIAGLGLVIVFAPSLVPGLTPPMM
jgi:hypothetical protein